jgi:hypothetical protein
MYSSSKIAVDKGLGFDFSQITDLVKSAATTGLNIYNNQLQVKQVQAMQRIAQQNGVVPQSPGVYGQQYGILPMSEVMQPQPTFGSPIYRMPSNTGMSTGTILMIGAVVIGGVLMFKGLAK